MLQEIGDWLSNTVVNWIGLAFSVERFTNRKKRVFNDKHFVIMNGNSEHIKYTAVIKTQIAILFAAMAMYMLECPCSRNYLSSLPKCSCSEMIAADWTVNRLNV